MSRGRCLQVREEIMRDEQLHGASGAMWTVRGTAVEEVVGLQRQKSCVLRRCLQRPPQTCDSRQARTCQPVGLQVAACIARAAREQEQDIDQSSLLRGMLAEGRPATREVGKRWQASAPACALHARCPQLAPTAVPHSDSSGWKASLLPQLGGRVPARRASGVHSRVGAQPHLHPYPTAPGCTVVLR